MNNNNYEDPNGHTVPERCEEQPVDSVTSHPEVDDSIVSANEVAVRNTTIASKRAIPAQNNGLNGNKIREFGRKLLEDAGPSPLTYKKGRLPNHPCYVDFGSITLEPMHRMAEAEGFYYEDGVYRGRNLIEPGATTDGFAIFSSGSAYDRKLGKKYSSREMLEFAISKGYGNYATIHEKGTVRCNPRPASVGSSASAPAFDWSKAKQWHYMDRNNKVLFIVGRVDIPASQGSNARKEIRQRRPDGQGGWVYNMDGVERVPYNLPKVLSATTVFVVEGEKAADALNAELKAANLLGEMIATTTAGGANNAHKTQFRDDLTGKTVVVLPDNDQPGQRYAHHFCSECIFSSIVKYVELPGLPIKGDVVDFFANGGTLQELLQLVTATPKMEYAELKSKQVSESASAPKPEDAEAVEDVPSDENVTVGPQPQPTVASTTHETTGAQPNDVPVNNKFRGRFRFLSVKQLFNFPEPQWLIKDFLVTRTLSLLTGPHSSFKSFVALDMAMCVALGRNWHGHKSLPGTVLYVAAEGADGLQKRIGAYLFHHDIEDAPTNFYTYPRAINFADGETIDDLIIALEAQNISPTLIIVDTLARCTPGLDENSARDMGAFIDGLNSLSKKLGTHVMIVHHNNKSGSYRGSSSLPAAVDTHFAIKRTGNEVSLSTEKQKDAEQKAPIAFETTSVLFPHPKYASEKLASIVLTRIDAVSNVAGYDLSPLQRKALLILVDDFGNGGASATDWEKACKDGADSNPRRTRRALVERGAVIIKDKHGKVITLSDWDQLLITDQKRVTYYPAQNSDWLKDALRRRAEVTVTQGDDCEEDNDQ